MSLARANQRVFGTGVTCNHIQHPSKALPLLFILTELQASYCASCSVVSIQDRDPPLSVAVRVGFRHLAAQPFRQVELIGLRILNIHSIHDLFICKNFLALTAIQNVVVRAGKRVKTVGIERLAADPDILDAAFVAFNAGENIIVIEQDFRLFIQINLVCQAGNLDKASVRP